MMTAGPSTPSQVSSEHPSVSRLPTGGLGRLPEKLLLDAFPAPFNWLGADQRGCVVLPGSSHLQAGPGVVFPPSLVPPFSSVSFVRCLFSVSVPGLDYVSHEDILPYTSTDQAPIQHELFERFLLYDQTKGNLSQERKLEREGPFLQKRLQSRIPTTSFSPPLAYQGRQMAVVSS